MKKGALFLSLQLILCFGISAQNRIAQKVNQYASSSFKDVNPIRTHAALSTSFLDANPHLKTGISIEVNQEVLQEILDEQIQPLRFEMPTPDGSSKTLLLVPSRSQSESFAVYNQDRVLHQINDKDAHHYWGVVEGEEQSVVALSIFPGQIMALISSHTDTYQISDLTEELPGRHLLYRLQDLDYQLDFNCGVEVPDDFEIIERSTERSVSNSSPCVRIYLEVDFDVTIDQGGIANTASYITGLFNQVSLLYFNENININLHELVIWESYDPYTSSTTQEILSEFREETGFDFNGDLAHLIGYSGSGGIAYLDVLCQNSFGRHAYSGIYSYYHNIPMYSWSVLVITHEIGHNLGSPHTHDCVWNGDFTAIDECGINAGYGTPSPCNDVGLPAAGTVMSYCHLVGVGIDFNVGFGLQPSDLIYDRVQWAPCLVSCEAQDEICDDNFDNDFDGLTDCEDPDCENYETCLPCQQHLINFSLTFDQHPWQNSWELTDEDGEIIASDDNFGSALANTTIQEEFCLDEACYTLTIYDIVGNGICCSTGDGNYSVTNTDGEVIAMGGTFGGAVSIQICDGQIPEVCFDGIDNDLDGLVDCEDPDCEEDQACISCMDHVVNLLINFDNYPEETSWEILDEQGEVVYFGVGSTDFPDGSTASFGYCLPEGCYDFRILDSHNDGLCCTFGEGSYVLSSTTGDIYASGGEFGTEEVTRFCVTDSYCPLGTTFVVTTSQDGIAGSLRQAINCANAVAPLDTIIFDLAPDDTLFIENPLPTIYDNYVMIDGGSGQTMVYDSAGSFISIASQSNTIRGLNLIGQDSLGSAIFVALTGANFELTNNRIENFETAIDLFGRSGWVKDNEITLSSSSEAGISLGLAADQVVIEDNTITGLGQQGVGINFLNIDSSQIRNNDISGLRYGIYSLWSNDVVIEQNTISNNQNGIYVRSIQNSNGQRHQITQNSIYCNEVERGIRLDPIANSNQQPPALSEATDTTLQGTAFPGDLIEVFLSDNTDCIGPAECQGRIYLGTTLTDADGFWLLTNIELSGGEFLTATATDSNNNTSSFASCLEYIPTCPEESVSLVVDRLTVCPGESVQFYLEGTQPWSDTFALVYDLDGEFIIEEGWRLTDTLVLYPEDDLNFYLLGAVAPFGCDLLDEPTEVQIQMTEDEDLVGYQMYSICPGEFVEINGVEVYEAGMYTELLPSVGGCDSLVQIEVSLLETTLSQEEINICEGEEIELFGSTVTESGTYEGVFVAANGCDSIHRVVLSVHAPIETQENLQICAGQSIDIFGEQISAPGTYTATFTASNGCDSIHSVVLTVAHILETWIYETMCEGNYITINGEAITESGMYVENLTSTSGCDSIIYYDLTVIDVVNTSASLQICDGQTVELFGETVSVAGMYSGTFTSQAGCDSTHSVNVTLIEPIYTDEVINACAGQLIYVFGEMYSEDITVDATFTAANGCDSTHTVQLIFDDIIQTNAATNICEGESIILFEQEVSTAGIYSKTFVTAQGCDSLHTIELTVLSPVYQEDFLSICEGESISIFGMEETIAGSYEAIFTGQNGCDSTQVYHLEVLTASSSAETIYLCEGESRSVFGELQSEPGIYEASFVAANGCDSLASIELIQFEAIQVEAQITASCIDQQEGSIMILSDPQNVDYQWAHSAENTSAFSALPADDYSLTITDQNGCDTDWTFTIEELPNPQYELAISPISCDDGSDGMIEIISPDPNLEVSLANGPYSSNTMFTDLEAGNYSLRIRTAAGCEVVEELVLVAPENIELAAVEIDQPSCEGEEDGTISLQVEGGNDGLSFNWSGGLSGPVVDNLDIGTYSVTIENSSGCQLISSFELSGLAPIEANMQLILGCGDGQIMALADPSEGQPPYDLAWSDGQTGSLAINLSAGSYSLVLTDANGCEVTEQFDVPFVSPFEVIQTSSDPSCATTTDGNIELMITGGVPPYTVDWAHGATGSTLDNLPAGIYNYNVTAQGCGQAGSVNLEAPPQLDAVVDFMPGNPDLQASAYVFGGTPPYTYQWSNGSTAATAVNLAEGQELSLTVIDANGCMFTNTYIATITSSSSLEAANFSIFPNPTSGQLFIEHTNPGWQYQLDLYSIDGAKMLQSTEVHAMRHEVALGSLPPGIYLLVASNANFQLVERIVLIP